MESSRKNYVVAAAVAAALGTGAAHALAPSATINQVFYEAGGSAQENAAYWATLQLLQPATVDIYTEKTNGAASGSYLIVTGTTSAAGNTALGLSASENILVFYKFNGGSFPNGAFPFTGASGSAPSTLAYPLTSAIATSVATGVTFATSVGPVPSAPTYEFTATNTTTNLQSPDWGLTDVEVPLFNSLVNLGTTKALNAAQLGNISGSAIYDDVFGLAITNAAFNGAAFGGHPKTGFTKAEVTGILTGAVTNWNQLFADDGTALPSVPVWLLDRAAGSGTKASGNNYFLANPAALAAGGALTPKNSAGPTPAGQTTLSLTGGYEDVNEASTAATVLDLIAANGAGKPAFAILSGEFPPAGNQSGGTNQYAFASLDGAFIDTQGTGDNINGTVATKYTNVVTGKYDFAYTNSFNTRTGFLSTTTIQAKFANAIKSNLQSETISGANSGKIFPLAVNGVLIDPVNTATQDPGVVIWTRNAVSPAPIQLNYDATTVNGNAIQYGSDPL
jgi:hypothetical protein